MNLNEATRIGSLEKGYVRVQIRFTVQFSCGESHGEGKAKRSGNWIL